MLSRIINELIPSHLPFKAWNWVIWGGLAGEILLWYWQSVIMWFPAHLEKRRVHVQFPILWPQVWQRRHCVMGLLLRRFFHCTAVLSTRGTSLFSLLIFQFVFVILVIRNRCTLSAHFEDFDDFYLGIISRVFLDLVDNVVLCQALHHKSMGFPLVGGVRMIMKICISKCPYGRVVVGDILSVDNYWVCCVFNPAIARRDFIKFRHLRAIVFPRNHYWRRDCCGGCFIRCFERPRLPRLGTKGGLFVFLILKRLETISCFYVGFFEQLSRIALAKSVVFRGVWNGWSSNSRVSIAPAPSCY